MGWPFSLTPVLCRWGPLTPFADDGDDAALRELANFPPLAGEGRGEGENPRLSAGIDFAAPLGLSKKLRCAGGWPVANFLS